MMMKVWFFCFKQDTAYDMRISDWSSDVCSSDLASYALLTLMVAQVCDLQPGEFIWSGGDCHLYANHLEQADLQLTREPLSLPTMKLNPDVKDLFAFRFEDFELVGYDTHPHIKAPVARKSGV